MFQQTPQTSIDTVALQMELQEHRGDFNEIVGLDMSTYQYQENMSHEEEAIIEALTTRYFF